MSVLATSTPVTRTKEETVEIAKAVETAKAIETARIGKNGGKSKSQYLKNLARVPCIRYHINFGKQSVSTLFDSGSEINAIYPAFAKKLGLSIKAIDIGVQKIDGTTLDIYGMVVAAFLVKDKAN